ncbi:MAG: epimerase [Deltaproteobacteria bacterium]|nr:epimerase [Deltaproteobacteria bacterium]
MAGSSVLVTGGAGYIGGKVVAALADEPSEWERIVATDVRAPRAEQRHDRVIWETVDIRSAEIAALFEEHKVNTVVHLASIVTPPPGFTREDQYSVDVDGTRNVLEACVAAGVGKIIVTSSGAAYGYHADNDEWLDERDSPLRGNESFAYAHHKRLVEEMLARYREDHAELAQLVFRPGTVLGAGVSNQITALFERAFVLGLSRVATPFVFIWDEDVAACILKGIRTDRTGIYNLAGDGVMPLAEIARRLGKPLVSLPATLVDGALVVLCRLGLTQYGPEQTLFLKHRPVLSNRRLKEEFGYMPRMSSREVFETWCEGRA